MGSGKSTLGKRLASKLDTAFLDLDEYFEQKYRTSITLFFERFGEDQFRKLEHEVLREVIDLHHDVVISTGGGTPCFFNNMELMNQHGVTVYLRLPAAVLAQRLSNSPFRYKRPKLKGLDSGAMLETITQQLEEREVFYNNSRIIIDVFKLNVDDIIQLIQRLSLDHT
jgi:shikimate kinase